MRLRNILQLRFRSLFSHTKVEQELDEEMRYHLDREIERHVAAGMSPREARSTALRDMGGMEQRKEECRDARGMNPLDHLWRDMLFALRQLRRSPGFTATAILMLAMGTCASVAIFAFVDAALLKPLPYRDPSGLTGVFETVAMIPRAPLSYPDYLDWKKQNEVFRSLDIYDRTRFLLSTPEGVQPVRGARVSEGFFRTLGIAPVLGRDFRPGEDLAGAPRLVMLSYSTWQNRYGGSPGVVGRKVVLEGEANTIIGVLPREFHFAPADPAEFWTAFQPSSECDLRRSCHFLWGVGRLEDGVSVQAASANMKAIASRLEKEYPGSNQGQGADVIPLAEVIVGDIRPILYALFGGAVLLLLIASVNVTSLLLVRSERRRREIAVRNALGASTGRLISQFLAEGLVLVVCGAVLGLTAAQWAMRLLTGLIPADMMSHMPFLAGLGVNLRLVAFAGAIALFAAALFTLIPAMRLPLSQMHAGLTEGSRGSAGMVWRRLGSHLVVLELAIAMVLLVGAGLLGKSLHLLLQTDLGLRPDHLATMLVAAPRASYSSDARTAALGREVMSRIASVPGVRSVGITSMLPLSGNGNTDWIRFPGRPYHGEHNEVNEREVSAGYFSTLGTKLVRGRYFADGDDQSKPPVVIINQALARKYFPGEDPIGQKMGDTSLSPKSMKEIVGIVEDLRESSLDGEIWPAVYYPFEQSPSRVFLLAVRTSQAETAVLGELPGVIRRVDSGLVTIGGETMSDRISGSPSAYLRRSSAWVVGGFAAVAFLLSVAGLYGVVSYSVSQRTREIGVRMALGAGKRSVYRLILKEAVWLTAVGTVLGVGGSVGAATLIRGLLFKVQPWDPSTLALVAAVLACSALLASFLPTRRAASVNPVEALRAE